MKEILDRPGAKIAYKKALDIAADEGRKIPDMAVVFPDGGEARILDTETLHNLKMGVDALIDKHTDAIKGPSRKAVSLMKLKKDLLGELETQNPAYGTAREASHASRKVEGAGDEGGDFMKKNVSVYDIENRLSRMTAAEREAYSQGVSNRVRQKILDAGDAASAWTQVMGNENFRQKLRTIMGDDGFERFERKMRAEAEFAASQYKTKGNSLTQERRVIDENSSITEGLMRKVRKGLSDFVGTREDKIRQLADVLTRSADPEELQILMRHAERLSGDEAEILSGAIATALSGKGGAELGQHVISPYTNP
jgi:hypothetical protein